VNRVPSANRTSCKGRKEGKEKGKIHKRAMKVTNMYVSKVLCIGFNGEVVRLFTKVKPVSMLVK